ncbi:MAG TPA: T9SS type A sorting domain-containing protein [Hanamia sp.]
MKQFTTLLLAAICLFSFQISSAQTGTSNSGPNLLGARGTFSVPYITVNTSADACLQSGTNTYNPIGNVGNKLNGCSSTSGNIFPCSDYTYTAATQGMQPEFTYSILKVMGDSTGSNCIHTPIWQAADHTGDGGYFLAVNGAPDITKSPIFYQIKSIPVCTGSTYEFSAWVINMMPPGGNAAAAPDISFVVNGNDTIATSGHIPYDHQWHKVGGKFISTTSTVDLKVVNSTFVASGNDLGLDDISINVVQSQVSVTGPAYTTEGNTVTPVFTVTDPSSTNTFYKLQVSTDGSVSFSDLQTGTLTYTNGVATFSYDITNASTDLTQPNANGNIYRLVVATTSGNLANPSCNYFNDYKLVVVSAGPAPVQLVSFNGTYSNGVANLNWQTSQEINNDRFELYRSFDGNDFELAATIAGAGNSSTPKNYSYQDRISPEGNNVYYKLRQIDIDGQFTFSNVVRLSTNSSNESFRIYPNPVVNNFTASFSAAQSGTAIMLIRNTNGQTMYKRTIDVINGNNAVSVNVPQLLAGMYFVTIVNDELNYNAKLQKQ